MNLQENTLSPRLLGYLGLLPFIASSLLIWSLQYHHYAVESLSVYAAVILTFMGGVHWGIAMQSMENVVQAQYINSSSQFIFSIIPSLLAWVTVVFLDSYSLIILAFCFILFWRFEKLHYQQCLPNWYSQLRNHLTLIATLSIIFGWLGTLWR